MTNELAFSTMLSFRGALATRILALDEEVLDATIDGCHNNLRWNIAHMIVTPIMLTYGLTGNECPLLSAKFIQSAKRGTSQDDFSLSEDYGIKHLSEYLTATIKQLQRDARDIEKCQFKTYETAMGYLIKNMDSALNYCLVHDGMHLGVIRTMLKILDARS